MNGQLDFSKLKDAGGNYDREKMDDLFFNLSNWTLGQQYEYTEKREQAERAKQLVELKVLYRQMGWSVPTLQDKATRGKVIAVRTKERKQRRRAVARQRADRMPLGKWLESTN